MTNSKRDFSIELYLEHLEEASFLYEQCLGLLDDLELTWLDLDDFEQRFEAHIDGLVLGEDLALEVCKKQASEGDFGELHAAIRVFCRQKRLDLVLETIEQIYPDDAEKVQAASDALNHELPEKWHNDFIGLLKEQNPLLAQIVPKLLGYRRVNAGSALLQALEQSDTTVKPTLIWALGRLREPKARVPLFNGYLQRDEDSVRAASALALLRLGEPQTLNHCLRQARSQNWPLLSLGLGSGPSAVSVLREVAAGEKATADCLLALGLLGDISAVETLLAQLVKKDRAESAAVALNLITGAGISEEVFIPEKIDEDELFEDELEKLKRGESLTPPGEKPRGTTITRVSQKPDEWRKWWMANKSRFNPQVRYRLGKPYSPATLLETLESEKSLRQVRQLAYEELVIRYSVDFPFETDMFVIHQKQALAKYTEWINANANRFQVGKWYFAGQLLNS